MSGPALPEDAGFNRAAGAGRSNLAMAPVLLLAGFAATVVVARALGPADFAVFAAAIAFRGLMGFIGDLGSGTAATRLFAQLLAAGAAAQARTVYKRLLLLRLAVVAALIALMTIAHDRVAELAGLLGPERDLIALFTLIAAFEVTATLGTSVLIGLFKHSAVNHLTLVSTFSQPTIIVVAVAFGFGMSGVVSGIVVGSAVRSLGANGLALLALGRTADSGRRIAKVARSYMRVASSAVVGKLAAVLHQRQILTFVALSAFGRAEVAAFALAYDFALQALNAIASPIYSLLLPGLTAVKDDRARTQRGFALVTRVLALTIGVPAVALAVLFGALVPTVFGTAYEDAVPYGVVFLLLFGLEVILSGPATAVMLADERLGRAYRITKSVTIAGAVLYLPLLAWSLHAVAVGMMVIRVASAIALHVVIARGTGMRVDGHWIRSSVLVLAATAGAAFVPIVLGIAAAAALIAGLVLAAAAAILSIRATRALEAADIDIVLRVFPSAARPLRFLSPDH